MTEELKILRIQGKNVIIQLRNVTLEIELEEALPKTEILKIGPSIELLYEEWRREHLEFFIFNRKSLQVELPIDSHLEVVFFNETVSKYEIKTISVKKILPLHLTPAERQEIIVWVEEGLRSLEILEESLFALPHETDYYIEGLLQAYRAKDENGFNRLLDEIIRTKFEIWRKLDEKWNPEDKVHQMICLILQKIFLGDLFYFNVKLPEHLLPEVKELKRKNQKAYRFFTRFFIHQLQEDRTAFWVSAGLLSLLGGKMGSIIHDFNLITTHDPLKAPISYIRSACTLIGDVFEIIKQVLRTIDDIFPHSHLASSLYPSAISDSILDEILEIHLDKNLRNHRFHENIEWVDGAGCITMKDGTSITYSPSDIEEKVQLSIDLFFVIYQTFVLHWLESITIRIPQAPITESFQIIQEIVELNPETGFWIARYISVLFSTFLGDPLLQENIKTFWDKIIDIEYSP